MTFKPIILPLGDSALLIQLGDEIDITINQRVHTLAALILAAPLPGLIEVVPAYRTLLIRYDPLILMEEEVDLSEYQDDHDAYRQIGQFLEDVYMRKRVHSSLNYLTPAEFETQWLSATLDSRVPL